MRERLGRYLILEEIGKGGMGVVYKARDERLGKVVALKVLSVVEPEESSSRKRFRNEARAAAVLNHPTIAAVFDYDEQDGTPFIVYEYVEGVTLDQIIAGEKLPPERIVALASQIAAGLAHAHDRGILHRDIKPQNIMVNAEGQVKILDFGLAKKTGLQVSEGIQPDGTTVDTGIGAIVGTVQYMSPEQIAGEVLDGRTDIFSFGIVLYEMAAGRNPFRAQSFGSTIGKIMSPEPPPFSTSEFAAAPGLQQIISKCLRKKRDERYSNAKTIVEELEALHTRGYESSPQPEAEGEAVIPRRLARLSLILLQILYLAMYGFALYYHRDVLMGITDRLAQFFDLDPLRELSRARALTAAFLTTACCGIPVRLYILVSVGFHDPETGRQFRKLYPFLFVLDELWALSPLLLIGKWPPGITLVCMALLVYLPISHSNLVHSAYPLGIKEQSPRFSN
jgi:tRNA A-37 threonylcarbamoyl transferase component Bud32